MMINTLLEHVPMKLEAPDNGDDEDEENNGKQKNKNVKTNGKNVVVDEEGTNCDEDDDDEDSDEDDSETDLLEDDDQETLLPISSDEEAELEAQRIRFPVLIQKTLQLPTASTCLSSENSKRVSETKNLRGRSVSSCASVSSKASTVSCSSASTITEEGKQTKCAKSPKQKEMIQNCEVKQTATSRLEERAKTLESELDQENSTDSITRSCRRRASSTCSVASSLVTPSCQTESCGNIYVYEEQQKLIFNCSFCDLRYEDMVPFARHLHGAHKLFQEVEDTTRTTPARKSSGNILKQQAENRAQTQDNLPNVVVKTEDELYNDDLSLHSISPIPEDATLESCGNVFILNDKKLFLICGHCECKYATLDLFHKHLRQQHNLFTGPVKEIDVLPKCQIKVEVRDEDEDLARKSTAAIESEKQRKASVEAMVDSPVMVVVPIAPNLENNEIFSSTVAVQIPETPPPDEEKLVEEPNDIRVVGEKVVTAEPIEDKEATAKNANVDEEAEQKHSISEVAPLAEEHAQFVLEQQVAATERLATENSGKQVEILVEETGKEDAKKPTAKRKRKRKSTYSRRSPPKRRAAAAPKIPNLLPIDEGKEVGDDAEPVEEPNSLPEKIVAVIPVLSTEVYTEKNTKKAPPIPELTNHTSTEDTKIIAEADTILKDAKDIESNDFTNSIPEIKVHCVAAAVVGKTPKAKAAPKSQNRPKVVAKRTRKSKNTIDEQKESSHLPPKKVPSPKNTHTDIIETKATTSSGTSKSGAAPMRTSSCSETHKLRYACNQCPKSFRKSPRLAEHMRLHTGEKPFVCDECGKTFRIKRRLAEHKMRHLKVKAYTCDTCGLPVATKQDLRLHQRHHAKDRRYTCPDCSKAFVRSSDLKIHKRVHTGEKPFVCEICQRTFRANQNLLVHRRSHLGEKNYKCDFCDKRFMRNIDRKVHHRTHTGERPFKCEICGRCYSSRAHVRTHVQREHVDNADIPKNERKKSERKMKPPVEEVENPKQLLDELQEQILLCLATDDLEEEATKSEKPAEIKKPKRQKSTPRSSPALKKGVESNATTRAPKKAQHSQSMGVQQVSVTVSMHVQKDVDIADEPMPEKENTATMVGGVSATVNKNAKNDRKITSYFTVLGQKTEI